MQLIKCLQTSRLHLSPMHQPKVYSTYTFTQMQLWGFFAHVVLLRSRTDQSGSECDSNTTGQSESDCVRLRSRRRYARLTRLCRSALKSHRT